MSNVTDLVVAPNSARAQLTDSRGYPTSYAQYMLSRMIQAINGSLNILGQFIGEIAPTTKIVGRTEGIGTTVQHINDTGVVTSPGMTAATDSQQGAVVLPTGSVSNTLGTAALESSSAFDAAGSAATAQSNAETYADGVGASTLTSAKSYADSVSTTAKNDAISASEAYSSNASNLTSGTVPAPRLPVTYGTGAPVAAGTENALYFDTTASPYHGYVYHSGTWVEFS